MGTKREDTRGMARPTFEVDTAGRMPHWLKVPIQGNRRFGRLKRLVQDHQLNTVCQSANCPNIGECWSRGAITFMILGEICTRSCGFCDVATGRPLPPDPDEAVRLAKSLAELDLRYAVITSVDRDDLPDGGAHFWAQTVLALRRDCPDLSVEALVPDFKGDHASLEQVIAARPHVLAHNLETVERLHPLVRPQANYQQSLGVIERAADHGAVAKSGLLVGLGESDQEVSQVLQALRERGCQMISIGQYLRPSRRHLPIRRWVAPETFERYREEALGLGFQSVMSAPLVRSSYRAEVLAEEPLLNASALNSRLPLDSEAALCAIGGGRRS